MPAFSPLRLIRIAAENGAGRTQAEEPQMHAHGDAGVEGGTAAVRVVQGHVVPATRVDWCVKSRGPEKIVFLFDLARKSEAGVHDIGGIRFGFFDNPDIVCTQIPRSPDISVLLLVSTG